MFLSHLGEARKALCHCYYKLLNMTVTLTSSVRIKPATHRGAAWRIKLQPFSYTYATWMPYLVGESSQALLVWFNIIITPTTYFAKIEKSLIKCKCLCTYSYGDGIFWYFISSMNVLSFRVKISISITLYGHIMMALTRIHAEPLSISSLLLFLIASK